MGNNIIRKGRKKMGSGNEKWEDTKKKRKREGRKIKKMQPQNALKQKAGKEKQKNEK